MTQLIPFNKVPYYGNELGYIEQSIREGKLIGDGRFCSIAESKLEEVTGGNRVLLTPSCTSALEMAAMLIEITPGDEVILPSYTFVSTANAFVLRGAKIVFVDIDPRTMNMDANLIEDAITSKTVAIVPVHYAGIGCDMDRIMDIANRHGLWVIEDAAQCIGSSINSRALGTIGHLGTFSFHGTKNITSGGEGGALLVNHTEFVSRSEIIREKGTDRKKFFRGEVDKYTWVDEGSSFLLSEIQAAFLCAQLDVLEEITSRRIEIWNLYHEALTLMSKKNLEFSQIPKGAEHNAHMFYIKCENVKHREELMKHLFKSNIKAVFHYVPLHSSPAGERFGRFHGADVFTTSESERLLRLPLFYSMHNHEVERVCSQLASFFE